MGVLTNNIQVPHRGTPPKFAFSANGADEFWGGALLFTDALGGVQVVPEAGDSFAGIVTRHFTAAAAGDEVEAYIGGVFKLPLGSLLAEDEGDGLIVDVADGTLSDNPADLVAMAKAVAGVGFGPEADDILVGRILRVESDGAWVYLNKRPAIFATGTGWGG